MAYLVRAEENAKTHHTVETVPGKGTCVTIEFTHRAAAAAKN
jgi:hypothetical protein